MVPNYSLGCSWDYQGCTPSGSSRITSRQLGVINDAPFLLIPQRLHGKSHCSRDYHTAIPGTRDSPLSGMFTNRWLGDHCASCFLSRNRCLVSFLYPNLGWNQVYWWVKHNQTHIFVDWCWLHHLPYPSFLVKLPIFVLPKSDKKSTMQTRTANLVSKHRHRLRPEGCLLDPEHQATINGRLRIPESRG